jgi:hypothetical protein
LMRLRTTADPLAFGTAGRGAALHPHLHEGTSRARESGSRPSGLAGRRRRNRGTAEPMSALHRRTLGRETLPAAGPPTLQDGAAGTRRQPRAKAVAALSPTHGWLIGPLQGRCKEGEKRGVRAMPSGQYRRASSTELSTGPVG